MRRGSRARRAIPSPRATVRISAVDLFCGAGGLTKGLIASGIKVAAGVDLDPHSEHAYTENNKGVAFHNWDLSKKRPSTIGKLFQKKSIRLLAGCAPCQPFSKLTNGIERHRSWDLLDNFGRFVKGIEPELVTMENVPELASRGEEVFTSFTETLERLDYWVDWDLVDCVEYGVPQFRHRLVLLASRLGPIKVPRGRYASEERWQTVRRAIGQLPRLKAGEADTADPIHVASKLSEMNQLRIRATPRNGGSKDSWPEELRLDCHEKESGERYISIYGRMWWDEPAPTMTTLCNGIGNGRFGHPSQHRAISLREAALLQSFPRRYEFWPAGKVVNRKAVARMIGNAVPPSLGRAIGHALMKHVRDLAAHGSTR